MVIIIFRVLLYHCVYLCSAKIEKEKKQVAKDAGFIKTEVSGAEVCAATGQFVLSPK